MNGFTRTPPPEIRALGPSEIPNMFAEPPYSWLVATVAPLADEGETLYLLVHADDGVLWGKIESGSVVLPPDELRPAALRTRTVQQCRVFGRRGELFVWRTAEGVWRGRVLLHTTGSDEVEERQLLWGKKVLSRAGGFTAIREDGVGMRHVVPLTLADGDLEGDTRLVLVVSHYLGEDEDGQTRVVHSRLKRLERARA